MKAVWQAILAVMLTAACSTDGVQPTSSNRPYEVVLTGDSDSTLYRLLSSPTEGLPQPEPTFDVSLHSGSNYAESNLRLARSIVNVHIKPYIYNKVEIGVRYDEYAKPQIVVSIGAPSRAQLDDYLTRNGRQVVSLLMQFERKVGIAQLQKERNPQAEKLLSDMFGVAMLVPADMLSSKKGAEFVWLSNNATSGMTNLCVFRGSNIDSTLAANIKGERPHSHMKLTKPTVRTSLNSRLKVSRGLWEMEGDAMGGPFVAHTMSHGNDSLTALAFVYAPESKKRNLMRQLENALYTIQRQQK